MTTTASFLAGQLDKVEKELNVFSNTTKTADRISSGSLVFDWTASGGLILFASIAGQEQSGKSTTCAHAQAEAVRMGLPLNILWDAEGTLNIKYASSIWKPFGINLQEIMEDQNSGFRYYRNNVIERFFDYMVRALNHLPDKVWLPEQKTWAFAIPKRNDYFKQYMGELELKPSKKLSNSSHFICPTDDSRPQGFVSVDSFAAMLTNEDEEKEEASNRRAVEASAFSKHLKRIMGKLPEKQVVMLGTNQLRTIPGVTYGEPYTEPGGSALQFYSSARWRTFSRSVPSGYDRDDKNGKIGIEDSVLGPGKDRYMYKELTNTKNKNGRPGLKSSFRVWISDHEGEPHGIDPFYDVYMHLLNTKQLTEKGNKLTFQFRKSMHPMVRELLNGKTTTYDTLKMLVLAEVFQNKRLMQKACKNLGIDKLVGIRRRLFHQLRTDAAIYSDFAPAGADNGGKKKRRDNSEGPEEL